MYKRMKKIFLLLLVFSMVGILPIACSKEDPKIINEPITVSLSLSGEICVEHEALTKVSSADLYGINVYYDKDKDGTIDNEYGYGLFDDISKMTITLISGYKYRFECILIKDGKNKLDNTNGIEYKEPFEKKLENKFILGDGVMPKINCGVAHMPGNYHASDFPELDRYYGETTNYEPIQNGVIDIYLKRCSFGVKYIITGLVDGSLTTDIKCFQPKYYNSDYITLCRETNSADIESDVKIYSFYDIRECWASEDLYIRGGRVEAKYDSNRGDLWDIDNSLNLVVYGDNVQFKRNILTVIYINVSPDLSSATMQFSLEEMTDENTIDIGINGNGLLENIIKPNEE